LENNFKISALASISRPFHCFFHRFLAALHVLEEQVMATESDRHRGNFIGNTAWSFDMAWTD
jgi:hypothetical protein